MGSRGGQGPAGCGQGLASSQLPPQNAGQGAHGVPPVRNTPQRMLPGLSPPFSSPGRGKKRGQAACRIKDAGHHAKGKGSTKERRGLRAALQRAPKRGPPRRRHPEPAARGPQGTRCPSEGFLGWSKPPGGRQGEPIPGNTPQALPHCHGVRDTGLGEGSPAPSCSPGSGVGSHQAARGAPRGR